MINEKAETSVSNEPAASPSPAPVQGQPPSRIYAEGKPHAGLYVTSIIDAPDGYSEYVAKSLVDPLAVALQAVIQSHCPNPAFYCGSCTPARAALAAYEGD